MDGENTRQECPALYFVCFTDHYSSLKLNLSNMPLLITIYDLIPDYQEPPEIEITPEKLDELLTTDFDKKLIRMYLNEPKS